MDININNLRKAEETGEEFKITCNYNLLDNNQFVRWNGDDITLLKPYGLSKVNRIDFRNFKGELLPYTSLQLPDLWFEVLMTSKGIDSATITSNEETIYGDTLDYNENNDVRSVYKFKKAWTYDSNEDSQLLYNIREGLDVINNYFNTLYPIKSEVPRYGITNNDLNVITYDYRPIDCNAGSMLFVADKSGHAFHTVNPQSNDAAHRDNFNSGQRACAQVAVNYANMIGFYWSEYSSEVYGDCHFIINTGTYDNPQFVTNTNPNIGEDWTVSGNKFGVRQSEPSFSMGHCPAGWCVCVSPLIGRSGERALAVLKTSTNYYWMDFRGVAADNLVYIAAVYDDPEDNSNIYVLAYYTFIGYPNNIVSGIFKVPFTSMSTSSSSATNMLSYKVYESNPMFGPTFADDWTTKDKLSTCGKECYGIQIAKDATTGDITGMIFIGVRGCAIHGTQIEKTTDLYAWKVDDTYMFAYDGDNSMKKVSIMTGDVMNRINNGYTESATETMPFGGSVYVCRAVNGWIQNPEIGQLRFLNDIPSDNTFNHNDELNARHAANAFGVDLSASAVSGSDTYQLANTTGGLATTDSENWFSFDNQNMTIPQLVFPDNKVLNFAIHIWTEPYYFDIYTPCQYFSSEIYSIVKPTLMPSYNWLNQHVINTLETLILLHYEYNNLKITCQMFPNMDGVVFFINEDAFIGFKSMTISNTIDGLKVSIIGDNEKVGLDTLRRLYGKLSLSVDWVQ